MPESEEYRRGLPLAGRRAWNDGYAAGLLAGLREAQAKTDGLDPRSYERVGILIAHVQRTGLLPEDKEA